ncbi:MAG: Ldh family oxidoreductase [Burkholderiaceae bacterium]
MTITPSELNEFATRLLEAGGYTPTEAVATAELLVWANLRGIDSHGVLRIPRYLEMVQSGAIRCGQTPNIVREAGAVCVIDFGKAPGAVAMTRAAAKAGDLAQQFGIGWCGARAISHAGAVGYFTTQLAERGLIGIAMTASKPLMSYFGAKGEALSTNPLSIAVPRDGHDPLLLDMSTAAVALGKILAARDAGAAIPAGWAVDAQGAQTTDPNAVAAVLPMAGPKGSGLSLMIEVLASVLVGNSVIGPLLNGTGKGGMNGVVLAVDPAAFGEPAQFDDAVEELVKGIRQLEPAPDVSRVMLPGERSSQTAQVRTEQGIALAKGTVNRLTELAERLSVVVPQSLR